MERSNHGAAEILDRVRDAFGRLAPGAYDAVEDLLPLYHESVVFKDPVQRVEGRAAFAELNRRLLRRARVLRVRVGDGAAAGDQVFLTWEMDYAYRFGPTVTLAGSSHLRLRDGKIAEHRDYWDVASSVADAVPGVRRLYRAIVARVA